MNIAFRVSTDDVLSTDYNVERDAISRRMWNCRALENERDGVRRHLLLDAPFRVEHALNGLGFAFQRLRRLDPLHPSLVREMREFREPSLKLGYRAA